MRYWRLTLGTAAILAAGWVITGEHLAGTSGDAIINAEVATVRAPAAGRLNMPPLPLGAALVSAQEVGTVADLQAETGRLDDLQFERVLAATKLERAEAELVAWAGAQTVAVAIAAGAPVRAADSVPSLAGLHAEVAAAQARLEALETRLEQERVRAARHTMAVLTAPVSGILWERLAGDGEVVMRGQDVLRVVDCSSTVVTLSVAQSVYDRLSVGSAATFRPAGTRRALPGTVIRMAGRGAGSLYRNLAVSPSERHLERQDVMLLVPGLREDPALACAVGRSGRAFFEARPLDGLRAWIR
jgi:biotin carboxyl carrier protein